MTREPRESTLHFNLALVGFHPIIPTHVVRLWHRLLNTLALYLCTSLYEELRVRLRDFVDGPARHAR